MGPACNSPQMLETIIKAGVNVCRMNFSHSTHADHLDVIQNVRRINQENNLHTCLLADLQGPKLRIGDVEGGKIYWEKGDEVIFTTHKCLGTRERVYITYQAFARDVVAGDSILVDDGKIELMVKSTNGVDTVIAEVFNGGPVGSKKGVNLPDTQVSLPSLTEKDLKDLHFALDNDVDWIALSFVRKPEDIIELKKIIADRGKNTFVVAKIEKPEAVKNIDEILKVTDGIMVARGDLGVEIHMEDVPMIQKSIVKKCMAASKPVIIATQMMESMITNPRPTRAETNDVANAVLDGADAVMLSAETSVGAYPLSAIDSMRKIITNVEKEKSIYNVKYKLDNDSPTFLSDALCANAVWISKAVSAKAIISMTKSGYTAFKISSFRPEAHVFIFSDNREMLDAVNLIWGVTGLFYDQFSTTDTTFRDPLISQSG
ncbi:MAG: pyruvate kinase [Bacteroidetes bacterium]|nr:pyruvate kinase [Bacteroidota bacterium]